MNDPLREPTESIGSVMGHPFATVGEAKAFQSGFDLGKDLGHERGKLEGEKKVQEQLTSDQVWAFLTGLAASFLLTDVLNMIFG